MTDNNNNNNNYGGFNQNNDTQPQQNNNEWYASRSYAEQSDRPTQSNMPQNNGYTAQNPQDGVNYSRAPYSSNNESSYMNDMSYGDNYSSQSTDNSDNEIYSSSANQYNGQSIQTTAIPNNHYGSNQQPPQGGKKQKKEKGRVGKGAVAAILAVCILASAGVGFGGGLLAQNLSSNGVISTGGMTIQKVVNTVKSSDSDSEEMSTEDIVAKAENSVVEITTEVVQTGALSKQYIESGAGSGVVITENGYIVTNNHVIDGAEKIVVTMHDGKTYDATLVGKDAEQDLALLKIDATGLTAATFANSDEIKTGEKVVAIGNPLGQLGGTVTEGIISATSREIVISGNSMNLIQTSAAINPGNSGGGLFNERGELIGITNAKTVDEDVEGLGFAIPVNTVESIIGDLKEHGYVTGRPQIGVSLVDVPNQQTAMMYGVNDTGVYVAEVTGAAAKTAGFEQGDRITKINDTDVSASADITKVLKDCKAGDTVTVTVQRNGSETQLKTVLDEDKGETATEEPTESANNGFRSGSGNYGNYGSYSGDSIYGDYGLN